MPEQEVAKLKLPDGTEIELPYLKDATGSGFVDVRALFNKSVTVCKGSAIIKAIFTVPVVAVLMMEIWLRAGPSSNAGDPSD